VAGNVCLDGGATPSRRSGHREGASSCGALVVVVVTKVWRAISADVDPVTSANSALPAIVSDNFVGGEMNTGHDFDVSSTSSSSNCRNVSCIASAAPPPSASSASFDG
jgi:hypothetical protein